MGLLSNVFGKKQKKKDDQPNFSPELYDEPEVDALEQYITENFGAFESVFHELVSPDIHVDIALIPPREGADYQTLVTMGMGAHRMDVPDELAEYRLEYAEMMVHLPKDWQVGSSEETWYWPLRWLKVLARLPIGEPTWLGFGHTVPKGEPFCEDTELNCVMLINSVDAAGEPAVATLPSGKKINFYTMLPLYEEEVNYKLEHGAEALLDQFAEREIPYPPVVDKNRANVCAE